MRFRSSLGGAGLLVAAALLALPLVAAACGGGSDGEGADSELRQMLQRMVLRVEDVPQGMQRASAFFTTNEEVAEAQADPQAELAKLERWGRRLGYDVTFAPGPEAPTEEPVRQVQNTVSLYD